MFSDTKKRTSPRIAEFAGCLAGFSGLSVEINRYFMNILVKNAFLTVKIDKYTISIQLASAGQVCGWI
jgi:hypothetical protein